MLKTEDCLQKIYCMFGVVRCIAAVVLRTYTLAGTPPPLVRQRILFAEPPPPSVRRYYVDGPILINRGGARGRLEGV